MYIFSLGFVTLLMAAFCACIVKSTADQPVCEKYKTESSCQSTCRWETPNGTAPAFRHDYKYLNNTYYKIHPAMQWMRAVQICAAEGAILAHPSNDLEIRIMIKLFANNSINNPVFWLGMSSMYSVEADEKFLTLDGKSLNGVFKNWTEGYPVGENYAKRCVIFRSKTFGMENVLCEEMFRFICHKRPTDMFEVTSISKGDLSYTSLGSPDGMIKESKEADVLTALQQCAREGSALAVPFTAEEIPVYTSLMEGKKGYWVGLFDNFGVEGFQNLDETSIQFPHLNWTTGFPVKGQDKSFVVMDSTGKYTNVRGEIKHRFFCARDHQLTLYGEPTNFPRYTARSDKTPTAPLGSCRPKSVMSNA